MAAQIQAAKERKANKPEVDIVDGYLKYHGIAQEIIQMRLRVETALKMNLANEWDETRSDWNGYEKKLIKREKETGQTIEQFMEWYNSDEFRKNGNIWLTPKKIDSWWPTAFDKPLSFDDQLEKAGYK